MPFALKLALRYFRTRRNGLGRFTAIIAFLGIAFGVGGLIFTQAFARGFADSMRDKLLANFAHVSVFSTDGTAISNAPAAIAKIASMRDVTSVEPLNFENALIVADSGSDYALIKVSKRPELAPNTVEVGRRLAEKLLLKEGDEISLITMAMQKPSKVRVGGVFETGVYDYDATWISCDASTYASIIQRAEFKPNVISVSVGDIFAAGKTGNEIRAALGDGFRVVDWQEANRPLFAALETERRAAYIVIALIVLFASLNITTTLALRVAERRADIAVLKTCGATSRSIISIFVFEGMLIAVAAIAVGVLLGFASCALTNRFGLLSLPVEVYSLGSFQLSPAILDVLTTTVAALILCVVASLWPSLAASRVSPLENIRRAG